MNKTLITLALIFLSFIAQSNPKIVMDSIGLEQKNDRIYVLHKIESGETLYTLAKRYRADMAVLVAANPGIDQENLRVGQLIRIPSQSSRLVATPVVQKEMITHEVQSGETLYRIAKKYNVEEADIKRLNNLPSNTLYKKQSLLIEVPVQSTKSTIDYAKISPTGVKEIGGNGEEKLWWAFQPIADNNTNIIQVVHTVNPGENLQKIGETYKISVPKLMELNAMDDAAIKVGNKLIVGYEYFDLKQGKKVMIDPSKKTIVDSKVKVEDKLKERIRTGIPINKRLTAMGVMIKGNSFTATNKHLALHRTAPAGSYIKITNPNNGRSTFVRVLGNIQNVDADKGVDIKLSKAACQAIGIVDAKFPVELEYNE
ncbi:MAG: LysM repeat protein [Arenicella sp.]|jgi:LysM repeat protein